MGGPQGMPEPTSYAAFSLKVHHPKSSQTFVQLIRGHNTRFDRAVFTEPSKGGSHRDCVSFARRPDDRPFPTPTPFDPKPKADAFTPGLTNPPRIPTTRASAR